MDKPEVGDIWRWDDEWTVLVVKQIDQHDFVGIALEDGWKGRWEFHEGVNDRWKKLA